jgi:hypothetical protein
LLVPVTLKDPAAMPDIASAAVTVATGIILWSGGQMEQSGPGMPDITGGV